MKPNHLHAELSQAADLSDTQASMNSASGVNSSTAVPSSVTNIFQHPPPPIGVPPPPPSLLASQNQSWLRVPPPGPPSLLPGPPPPIGGLPPPVPGAPPVSIPSGPSGLSPAFESPVKTAANSTFPQPGFNDGSYQESPLTDDPFAPSLYELRAMERSTVMRPQQGLLPAPGPPLRNFREDQQSRAFDSRGPGNRDWRQSNQGGSNFDRRGRDDRRNRGQDWNRRDRNNGGGRGADRDNRDRYNRSGFNSRGRDSDQSQKRDRGSRWGSSDKERRGSNRDKKSDNQDNGHKDETNSGFYIPPVEPEEKISQDKVLSEIESDSPAPAPAKQDELVASDPPSSVAMPEPNNDTNDVRSPKLAEQEPPPTEPETQNPSELSAVN